MVKVADAVVIGGGIMGASAAHFLAKKGLGAVVLLEKRSLAAVSTGHSAAVIRTFYSNDLTIQLSMKALEMFANGPEALGGDCDFRNTGYICLLGEETAAAGLAVLEAEQRNHTRAVEVEADKIGELVPGVNPDGIVAGIYEPASGYADPVRTVRNLVTRAADWGLACHEGRGGHADSPVRRPCDRGGDGRGRNPDGPGDQRGRSLGPADGIVRWLELLGAMEPGERSGSAIAGGIRAVSRGFRSQSPGLFSSRRRKRAACRPELSQRGGADGTWTRTIRSWTGLRDGVSRPGPSNGCPGSGRGNT